MFAATAYRSQDGRVFPVGDSVHRRIPTGAYEMNPGLGERVRYILEDSCCL